MNLRILPRILRKSKSVVNDEIAVECKGFKICRRQVKKIMKVLRECAPWDFPVGSLSIAFVDDKTICNLHEKFLGDSSKTDVITFPGDESFPTPSLRIPSRRNAKSRDAFAGEIVVCVPQAIRAAKVLGGDPAGEILLYLVHGWLHLVGFDDKDDESQALMRKAEEEVTAILREHDAAPITRISFPKES